MRIAGLYSFNRGADVVAEKYPDLRAEVFECIEGINAARCITKSSEEKTMPGKMLYSPVDFNNAFKTRLLGPNGWQHVRVRCEYPTSFYVPGYATSSTCQGAFREMDFVKRQLGMEVQFGKYSFMVYNVAAKMTIFRNLGFIDTGIEVVPVKALADNMSTGVSYFEQFVWDLEKRGVSDIDIPVLVVGIDA